MDTARQRNAQIRETLADFTGTQMIAFLKGLNEKTLARVQRAMKKLGAVVKKEEEAKIKKQIARLETKLTRLKR